MILWKQYWIHFPSIVIYIHFHGEVLRERWLHKQIQHWMLVQYKVLRKTSEVSIMKWSEHHEVKWASWSEVSIMKWSEHHLDVVLQINYLYCIMWIVLHVYIFHATICHDIQTYLDRKSSTCQNCLWKMRISSRKNTKYKGIKRKDQV